jgi:signal transduction histidine kinase
MTLLADLGATAQSGLDVSLTLPAVLAQLQAGLDLSHLVVRAGAAGRGGELLALGARPDSGTTVSFPLHRALRTVGVLEVTSRQELPVEHSQVLQAAADIIAGFLHNTELFEREQLAVARLQSLDRLKDDFLGTVSHELRTPLTIIMGFLSMLRSRWRIMSDEERTGAFTTIGNHATALTALVNDLLDFVTDRRGADQLQVGPVALAASVDEIVERFRPMFAEHSLSLSLDESTTVATDPRAVERIVTNLLSNAVKYSPRESVIEVRVGAVPDGGAVVVQDHGPGIAPHDRELVFERFYRGSTDAARGTRGTGIGLTIVKTWLELVGARLEVRSVPGSGTEMTVVFPLDADTALDEAGQIVWRELAGTTTGRAS